MATKPPEPSPDQVPKPADLPVEPDDGAGQPIGIPRDPDSDRPLEPPRVS